MRVLKVAAGDFVDATAPIFGQSFRDAERAVAFSPGWQPQLPGAKKSLRFVIVS